MALPHRRASTGHGRDLQPLPLRGRPEIWSKRYDHINAFERLLADSGTLVLKFYLHIDRKEQLERFKKRIDNPKKN